MTDATKTEELLMLTSEFIGRLEGIITSVGRTDRQKIKASKEAMKEFYPTMGWSPPKE